MAEFPVWGIHLTTSSLRAVLLETDGDDVVVAAHDLIDFAEEIEDLASLERHGPFLHALAVFSKRHDLRHCRVVVSVDGATSFNRFVAAPLIQGESLARILSYEAQQQIPFSLEEVYWDYKSLDVRQEDNEADVLLFAIRKDVVDERLRRLAKMQFPVDAAQIAPIALYNFAVHERLAKDGYVIVAPDFDRTDIVICHDRRFWYRSLPTGTHSIFVDLAGRLDARFRQAVKMVRGDVPSSDQKEQAKTLEEGAERLGVQIAQLVAYYGGALPDFELKGIVLLPCGQAPAALARVLKSRLGADVYGAKSFRNFRISQSIVTPEIEHSVAALAHAAGLALQGLGLADVEVKMHPPTMERVITGRRVFYVLAGLVVLLLVGMQFLAVRRNAEEVDAAARRLESIVGELEAGRQKFDSLREESVIKDEMMPYRDAGRQRLAPVKAVDLVLEKVAKWNLDRPDGESLHIISIATKSPEDGSADRPGKRRVEFIVGVSEGSDRAAARNLLQGQFLADLADEWQVSQMAAGEEYSSSTLSFSATPNIDEKELRRRFLMTRVSFVFDDEMHAMGEMKDG